MYRIAFNAKANKFVIEIRHFWLFWLPLAATFDNYYRARAWVQQIGLNNIFEEHGSSYKPALKSNVV
jgi:hypothetical protein